MNEPADRPYGERAAFVSDPFGNYWFIATRVGLRLVGVGLGHVTPSLLPSKASPLIDFLKRAFGAKVEGSTKKADTWYTPLSASAKPWWRWLKWKRKGCVRSGFKCTRTTSMPCIVARWRRARFQFCRPRTNPLVIALLSFRIPPEIVGSQRRALIPFSGLRGTPANRSLAESAVRAETSAGDVQERPRIHPSMEAIFSCLERTIHIMEDLRRKEVGSPGSNSPSQ